MARAFSLLEVMVTLAMLAVIASLAVPALLPQVQKAQLTTAVDAVAAFAAAARDEAISSRRCTRVRMVARDLLVVEVANTMHCEVVDDADVPAGSLLEAGKGPWIESRRLRLESPRLDAVFHTPPAGFEAAPQLRFRPTGRIFTLDTFIGDDNVVVEIIHPVLLERRHVLVMNNGFLCIPPLGFITPASTPSSYRCGGAP